MGVDEETSNGGGVECCEQGSHSKRGAVNYGISIDIIHDFGDGSSGGSEGFLAYKRWRQLRSTAESKVQEDGRASVGATCCSTKQDAKGWKIFCLAALPVYKHEENLQEQWKEMEDLTRRICSELVRKEGYIAIWLKPLNNSCYLNLDTGVQPCPCNSNDNPDNVWFAAALHDLQVDCWVRNVVPVSGFNTLPVIYDQGLIRVIHDWCEPFNTYPRTYDLFNQKRCNISTLMLEMDQMLRPGGHVYIQDSVSVMGELQELAAGKFWFLRNVCNELVG